MNEHDECLGFGCLVLLLVIVALIIGGVYVIQHHPDDAVWVLVGALGAILCFPRRRV